MYIPNDETQLMIALSVDYNYWLKRLDTQINEAIYQNPQGLLSNRRRKRYFKTLGTWFAWCVWSS